MPRQKRKVKQRGKIARVELLEELGVQEFFLEGSITVDKRTCKGVECQLCVKMCPTHALFWGNGEVGILSELCVFCGACVLNCIVDDCIEIVRKRQSGEVERFSKPIDLVKLQHKIDADKRFVKVKAVYPTSEEYLNKHKRRGKRK